MSKQSSIDFIIKEFSDILGQLKTQPIQDLLLLDAVQKAKEMHKKEIEEAFASGIDNEWHINKDVKKKPQQYYTQTFEQ